MAVQITAVLSLLTFTSWAQDTRNKEHKVEGEYQMRIEESMTTIQAKETAIQRAKIEAIKSKLGEVIVQGNATYLRNSSNGQRQEALQAFNMMSETFVNGEWIRDIKEPIITQFFYSNPQTNDKELWIKAEVFGIVQELTPNVVEFQANSLSCPNISCQTITFNDNQSYYFGFISPVDGFLTVFLDSPEEGKTYRLLPYSSMGSETAVPITANQTYIFFNKEPQNSKGLSNIDKLILEVSGNQIQDLNKLFVIFSPKLDFTKPILSVPSKSINSNQNEKESYKLPLNLSSEDFQKWINQLRSKNRQIQLHTEILTIRKN